MGLIYFIAFIIVSKHKPCIHQLLGSHYLGCSQSPATFAISSAYSDSTAPLHFTTSHNDSLQEDVNNPHQYQWLNSVGPGIPHVLLELSHPTCRLPHDHLQLPYVHIMTATTLLWKRLTVTYFSQSQCEIKTSVFGTFKRSTQHWSIDNC